jgi:hypothetical protein
MVRAFFERLTKPPEQGAAPKTVRLYGEALQRSYGGFVRRSYIHAPLRLRIN